LIEVYDNQVIFHGRKNNYPKKCYNRLNEYIYIYIYIYINVVIGWLIPLCRCYESAGDINVVIGWLIPLCRCYESAGEHACNKIKEATS
jgi:hypothetical protein